MSKVRSIILLLFVLATSRNSFGQAGFLGKKNVYFVSTSLNITMNRRLATQSFQFPNSWGSTSFEPSIFPPKCSAQAGRIVGGHVLFSLEGNWFGIKNSAFDAHRSYENGNQSYTSLDKFRIRSNAYSFNFSTRFYGEFAPVGRYISLDFGVTRVASKIYATYSSVLSENEIPQVETEERKEPGIRNTNLLSFSFGCGRTYLIAKDKLLDYGFKSTLFFGKVNSVSQITSSKPYMEQFDAIVDLTVKNNILSSSLLELYVKIGISK